MTEAIFNRIVGIVESGDYGGSTLRAKGLRSFPDSIDAIVKPKTAAQNAQIAVLILPRADTGWVHGSGAGWFSTTFRYDLSFYIQRAKAGNDALGIADVVNLNMLAAQIFLSRLQLQLAGQANIAEIAGEITWQTTSNLAVPISYPPSNVSSGQGASLYWGFVAALTVPYRQFITFSSQG